MGVSIPESTFVDPTDIPETMTREQLEDFLIFSVLVANKSADATRTKLNYMYTLGKADSPFDFIARAVRKGVLGYVIREAKTGQYTRIKKALEGLLTLDLDNLSVAALEAIHGIGPKTARFAFLYIDRTAECVPLDTHILKELRLLGYEAPKSTPPAGKTYNRLEAAFVVEAKKRGLTVAEYDTQVWQKYTKSVMFGGSRG